MTKGEHLAVMALTVRAGRMAYVLLIDEIVKDLALSRVATRNEESACAKLDEWLRLLRPNAVVIEDYRMDCKKSDKTKRVIRAIKHRLEQYSVDVFEAPRTQEYRNIYDEARWYGKCFPEVAHLVPKRREPWASEPSTVIYFEALALARLAGFFPDKV